MIPQHTIGRNWSSHPQIVSLSTAGSNITPVLSIVHVWSAASPLRGVAQWLHGIHGHGDQVAQEAAEHVEEAELPTPKPQAEGGDGWRCLGSVMSWDLEVRT